MPVNISIRVETRRVPGGAPLHFEAVRRSVAPVEANELLLAERMMERFKQQMTEEGKKAESLTMIERKL